MSLENVSQNHQSGLLPPLAAVLAGPMLVSYTRFNLITVSTPKSFTDNMAEVVALSVLSTSLTLYLVSGQGNKLPWTFTAITELVLEAPELFMANGIFFSVTYGFCRSIESEIDALAENFCRQGESDQEEIKKAIRKVPIPQREVLGLFASKVSFQNREVKEATDIIGAIVSIPERRRPRVVKIASKLSSPDMRTEEVIETINAISNSGKEMRAIIYYAIPCSKPIEVIRSLLFESLENQEKLIDLASKFGHLEFGVPEPTSEEYTEPEVESMQAVKRGAEIMVAISEIPAEDREAVVDLTLRVGAQDWEEYKIKNIMKAISKIPAEDRRAVVDLTSEVGAQDWNEYEIKYSMIVIGKIPAQDREAVVRLTKSFCAPNASSDEKMDLMKAISEIPAEDREAVVRLAKSFCAPNASSDKKMDLMKAISEIPAGDREAIVNLTLRFSTPTWRMNDIANIMKAISEIPAEDREAIVNLILRFSPPTWEMALRFSIPTLRFSAPKWKMNDRVNIMKAIKNIPAGDREAFIDFVKQIDVLSIPMEEGIRFVLGILRQHNRASIVRLVSQCINPRWRLEYKMDAMEIIKGFSEEGKTYMLELWKMSGLKVCGQSDWGMSKRNLRFIIAVIVEESWKFDPNIDGEVLNRAMDPFVNTTLRIFKEIIRDQIEDQHIRSIAQRVAKATGVHGARLFKDLEDRLKDAHNQRDANVIATMVIEELDMLLSRSVPSPSSCPHVQRRECS